MNSLRRVVMCCVAVLVAVLLPLTVLAGPPPPPRPQMEHQLRIQVDHLPSAGSYVELFLQLPPESPQYDALPYRQPNAEHLAQAAYLSYNEDGWVSYTARYNKCKRRTLSAVSMQENVVEIPFDGEGYYINSQYEKRITIQQVKIGVLSQNGAVLRLSDVLTLQLPTQEQKQEQVVYDAATGAVSSTVQDVPKSEELLKWEKEDRERGRLGKIAMLFLGAGAMVVWTLYLIGALLAAGMIYLLQVLVALAVRVQPLKLALLWRALMVVIPCVFTMLLSWLLASRFLMFVLLSGGMMAIEAGMGYRAQERWRKVLFLSISMVIQLVAGALAFL